MRASLFRRGFTLLETLVMLAVLAIFTLLLTGLLKLQSERTHSQSEREAVEEPIPDNGPTDG